MTQHPLILSYNQTVDFKFPLTLVIGREPNHDSVSDGTLGYYDFTAPENRRCAFWNVSFSILGRFNNLTTKQCKSDFVSRKSSPVVFADAFPQGIKNEIKDKHDIRKLQAELLSKQVDAIFSHNKIIERTKLILLSGLSDPIYCAFKSLIIERTNGYEIAVINVPFFYPTNTPKIVSSFNESDQQLIKDIYTSFVMETNCTN